MGDALRRQGKGKSQRKMAFRPLAVDPLSAQVRPFVVDPAAQVRPTAVDPAGFKAEAEACQACTTEEPRLHARRMQLAEAAEEALAGLRATVERRGECRRRASQAAREVLLEAGLLGHAGASLDDIIGWRR